MYNNYEMYFFVQKYKKYFRTAFSYWLNYVFIYLYIFVSPCVSKFLFLSFLKR